MSCVFDSSNNVCFLATILCSQSIIQLIKSIYMLNNSLMSILFSWQGTWGKMSLFWCKNKVRDLIVYPTRSFFSPPIFPSSAVEHWTKAQSECCQALPKTLYFTLHSGDWHYSRQYICIPLLFEFHPANYGIINRTFFVESSEVSLQKVCFHHGDCKLCQSATIVS